MKVYYRIPGLKRLMRKNLVTLQDLATWGRKDPRTFEACLAEGLYKERQSKIRLIAFTTEEALIWWFGYRKSDQADLTDDEDKLFKKFVKWFLADPDGFIEDLADEIKEIYAHAKN